MEKASQFQAVCRKCGYSAPTAWQFCPRPGCGSRDNGVESDMGWHRISRLFAHREDFDSRSGSTFGQWFSGDPELFGRWLAVKDKLSHPEKIPWPGGPSGSVSTARTEFLKLAGVGRVTLESFSDIAGRNFMQDNPFLMKLADQYVAWWQEHFAKVRGE